MFLFFLFVLGALLGSFLNVVIYRWPREESVVTPRSSCPKCKKKIPFYLNIPILSWFFLRGRSFCCGERIDFIYPLVEALTGFLFALTYFKFGWSLQTLEYLIFIFMAVPCVFIDLKHYLLPDIFTIPGMAIGVLGSFFVPARMPLDAILGVVIGGGAFWLISWFYERVRNKEGMGFGDVKLIAWLGALGGVSSLSFIIFVSSFFGAVLGVGLMIFKRGNRNTPIPFGPFLIGAAFLYYFFSPQVLPLFSRFFIFL